MSSWFHSSISSRSEREESAEKLTTLVSMVRSCGSSSSSSDSNGTTIDTTQKPSLDSGLRRHKKGILLESSTIMRQPSYESGAVNPVPVNSRQIYNSTSANFPPV